MTTVPPPTVALPQVTPTAASAPIVQILAPPPAIAALSVGSVLEAVVLPPPPQPPATEGETAAKAVVALRTPQGDVRIQLPVPLPKGTEVELQVVRTTPQQVTMRVVTIDHQPATQALAQLRQAAQPQTPAPVQQPPKLPPTTAVVQPGAAWTPRGPTIVTELGPVSGVVVKAPAPPPTETLPAPAPQAQQAPSPQQVTTPATTPALPLATLPAQTPLPTPAPANVAQLLTQASALPVAEDGAPIFAPVPMTSTAPIVGTAPVNIPQFLTLIAGGEVAVRIVGVQVPDAAPVIAPPPTQMQPSSAPIIIPAAMLTSPAAVAPIIPTSTPVVPNTPAPGIASPVTNIPVATPPVAGTAQGQPAPAGVAPSAPVVTAPVIAETLLMEAAPKQPGLVLPGPQGLGPVAPAPPQAVQTQPVLTTLNGVVVSNTAAIPVIRTEAGEIQINLRANLPVGTRVVLEVLAQIPPRGFSTVIPPMPPTALPLSGPPGANVGWPTLQESLAVLERADPPAAQQLAQVIPDGGPRTALAMISFVQAMRTGDSRQWPGDKTLRVLERTGPRGSHLASTLSDEVSALSSRARDVGPEWRALPMPWNVDGRIERIALITRREGTGDDDEAKKKSGGGGTRFLINLDLSRLGEMQLDGMFRKETRGFDMMIRTRAPLPDDMRLDLTGLFANSNAAMGLKGTLSFQVVKKFPDPVNTGPLPQDKSGLWV